MSWFRNLIVYRVPHTGLTATALEASLAAHAFTPAASMEEASVGWVPPREGDSALVRTIGQQCLLALRHEKKLLPAKVVATFVRERAQAIEAAEGFKPGRKRLKELKGEVRDSLLPRAFGVSSDTRAWIDPVNGWLVVDTVSQARADEVITRLVKAIDLPARRLTVGASVPGEMTAWLVGGDAPSGFTVDQDAELKARDGKASVRYANQSPEHDDVARHTRAGKQCTKLALTWNDRVSFVLTDRIEIKRVRPLDILKEQAGDAGACTDADERFASDFTLMTGEFAKLLGDLVGALGERDLLAEAA